MKRIITIFILVAVISLFAVYTYRLIFGDTINQTDNTFIFKIENPTNLKSLLTDTTFNKLVQNKQALLLIGKLKQYSGHIKPGNYIIKPGMSNNELINMLRIGQQQPVMVTFNNIRTKEELAGNLGQQLLIDSLDILKLLRSQTYLQKYQLDTNTAVCPFLPDTYEMYWTISAESLFKRMLKEMEAFWNEERSGKAANIGLNYTEVVTLASIVNEESNLSKEQPIIAGLYINRLKRAYLLQADPTLRFAMKDFEKQRILNADKLLDSPFNTYKYKGLPPGPIRIPTKTAIDAVLNYKKHNYLYMCAKADFSGEHHFSETLTEHLKYAREYQRKLNQLRIYK